MQEPDAHGEDVTFQRDQRSKQTNPHWTNAPSGTTTQSPTGSSQAIVRQPQQHCNSPRLADLPPSIAGADCSVSTAPSPTNSAPAAPDATRQNVRTYGQPVPEGSLPHIQHIPTYITETPPPMIPPSPQVPRSRAEKGRKGVQKKERPQLVWTGVASRRTARA